MSKRIMIKYEHKLIELSKHKNTNYLSGYVQALLDWSVITVYEYTKLIDQIIALEREKVRDII